MSDGLDAGSFASGALAKKDCISKPRQAWLD